MLLEHTKAPDFSAVDQFGKNHTLSDYKGKWLLLYFYPKDDTPGCTKEACAIRDAWTDFTDGGIHVLGVSKDSVKSHKKFAEKYSLPFPLLADEEKKLLNDYEALGEKTMYGKLHLGTLRVTYLIDPDGNIAKAYPNVKPDTHAQEILEDLKKMTT
ncbi:MAG TPA: peroxiredoxin [Candidatus Andersenbacteria bacterium]|nr:peroxiredoxin [Candidatus Andersenbacteria bacterium]